MGRRISSAASVLAVLGFSLLVLGCPNAGGGGGGGGSDTTPPTFGGLTSVTPEGLTQMILTWDAASDNDTAAEDITYEIWQADIDNLNTNTPPTLTTTSGTTTAEVSVPGFKEQYFLVQATDSSGNRDGNATVLSATTTQAIWDYLDGGGATDGVDSSNGAIPATALAEIDGDLYIAWVDLSQYPGALRVSRYTSGSSWTSIDGGGLLSDPANNTLEPVQVGQHISLTNFNGRLYVAYVEDEISGTDQIKVASYDPLSPSDGWIYVHGDSGALNDNVTQDAGHPDLEVVDDTLYAVWVESVAGNQIYAAEYNGNDSSPVWTSLGSINYDTGDSAARPNAEDFNGSLVVAWEEPSSVDIRSKVYDPTTAGWSSFDSGSLNHISGEAIADHPRLVEESGTLYLFWRELSSGDYNQLRARARSGASWTFIDGGSTSGLNFDANQAVLGSSAPFVLNGQVYVAFTEDNSSFVPQARVLLFNGDIDSPAWQFVDGNSSNGLNVSPGEYGAASISASSFGTTLVVGWTEQSGIAIDQNVRVIQGR